MCITNLFSMTKMILADLENRYPINPMDLSNSQKKTEMQHVQKYPPTGKEGSTFAPEKLKMGLVTGR